MEATWTGTHRAMLEQAVRLWQQETQAANLSAKERLEVEKGLADAKVTLHREVEQEEDRIRRSDADADLAISRLKIEAQKSALEQELQARQINAAQKLQQLRALTEQEYQLNLAALQDELKLLREQPVEYERVYNQIRVLKAKEVADLAALDRQAALDAKRQADSELALHKDLSREIMTAEDGLVRGIFSGRQTLTQSLLAMGQNFLEREIANDLKYLTMRLLFGREEEAADKSSATGGLLVHLFAETAKTSATVTGTAARTTAITAGAAEQQAVEASAAKSGIFKHAASAAAAVYDDVAQIPYVGWILAPPAAAAAFAAVAAFGDLIPSFDVGSSMIGSTGLAMVHQGEAIVPAASAAPWRDGDGQQPLQISFAIHTPDAGGMANLLKSQQQTLQGMITKAVRDGYRAA